MSPLEKKQSEESPLQAPSGLPLFSPAEAEREKKKAAASIVATLLVVTVLLMIAIFTAVKLNEVAMDISDIRNEINTLEKKKRDLESELEKKNDMIAFEQRAQNELGMLKGQGITTDDREDKIE